MRPTGGRPPVSRDRQDWTILDEGEPVGRIYEDASASTPADMRWTWSITVYVWPDAGIATSGKAPTLAEAKAQFKTAWRRWLAWANLVDRAWGARCRVGRDG
jgi:hypothetical protein